MEKVRKNDIVTALSISSSRVAASIAILDEEICPNIVGLGKSDGKLLGGKGVLDIDALSKAIRDSLKAAQEEAEVESPRAFVSISGGSIKSEKSRGIIKLSQRGKEISDKDVRDVLKVADTVPINIEREIIHSIPQDFIVDSQNDVKNPVGLYGVKLEVETLLITAHLPFLQNIIKSLNLAGLELEDIVFSGIAVSKSLLSQDTKEKGVILIEIDNNFTTISFLFDNTLRGAEVCEKHIGEDGVLEILREKLDLMRKNKPASKIILIANSFISEDIVKKMEKTFGIPTQVGYSRNAKGKARDINNPSYITSIGLARYILESRRDLACKRIDFGLLHKITKGVRDFLNEYF